jgi:hypothetical protein
LLTKSTLGDKLKIPLINPEWNSRGLARFLNIVLYSLDQQPDEKFNQVIYQMSCSKSDERYLVQFESPISDSGLQVRKTYSIPRRGYSIMLTLTLTNKTACEVSFDNGEHGLSVVLGPGMGSVQDTGGSARHDHV